MPTGLRALALAVPLAALPGPLAPYDAPKAWWLQVLVLVSALTWAARCVQQGGDATRPDADRWLILLRRLVAGYAGWWVVTTFVSAAPGQSALGSFARAFGLLTVLAALALFPLVQASCRTENVRRSVVDAALLGSAGVCLLGVWQAFVSDGLPGTTDPAAAALRVRSTLGHHVLLGGYLALAIPLAAARFASGSAGADRIPLAVAGRGAMWLAVLPVLVWLASAWPVCWLLLAPWGVAAAVAWDAGRTPAASGLGGIPLRAALGALLAVQVLVLTLSGARGPFAAALLALGVVAVLLWRRSPEIPRARVVAVAALAVVGVVAGALAPALTGARTQAAIGRLADPDSDARYSADVRLRAWTGILGSVARQAGGEEVVPGQRPWVRTAVGYGLDTQELVLEAMDAQRSEGGPRVPRGQVRLVFDRAHNALLDHLVTAGVVGAGLWLAVIAGVLAVGIRRLRASAGDGWTLRVGCLGAVLGHLVDGATGIETAVSAALFWMGAALLTAPEPTAGGATGRRRVPRGAWIVLLVALVVGGTVATAATTVWLIASVAYTGGIFAASAGRLDEALLGLAHASRLVPGLPAPRSAAAQVGLRLAAREPDPAQRAALLREAEARLQPVSGGIAVSGRAWLLRGRIALARAEDGEPGQLPLALSAFATADRLQPNHADVLVHWAVALVRDGRLAPARGLAERVLSTDRRDWLAWAVVARAAAGTADARQATEAVDEARRLVPPGSAPYLERFLAERAP